MRNFVYTFDTSRKGYCLEDSFYCFEDCDKDSCYTFMGSGLTWNFNRYFCKSCGGDLVSIETKEEWNFITGEIRNRSTSHWSIGLVKIDGKWTWVSGRPLTITKWRDNQQSNNKLEVFIVKVSGGQELSTLPAGAVVNNFICEFPKGRTQLRLLSAQ